MRESSVYGRVHNGFKGKDGKCACSPPRHRTARLKYHSSSRTGSTRAALQRGFAPHCTAGNVNTSFLLKKKTVKTIKCDKNSQCFKFTKKFSVQQDPVRNYLTSERYLKVLNFTAAAIHVFKISKAIPGK